MAIFSVFQLLKQKFWGSTLDSKNRAKSRLHFVLVQDRTGLSAEDMASFKRELIRVIERYFIIDKQGFDVSYHREGKTTTLLINSPVVVRRQESPDKNVGAKPQRRGKNRRKTKAQSSAPEAAGIEPASSDSKVAV